MQMLIGLKEGASKELKDIIDPNYSPKFID